VTSRITLTLVVVAALFAPDSVLAQAGSSTETQLQMERRQRRAIVRPSPPAETVERDVEAAAAEVEQRVEQRRRQDDAVRELRRPPRRPDLDYDVKSGIQSQRLNDALRR
jgi:hypothetical protein